MRHFYGHNFNSICSFSKAWSSVFLSDCQNVSLFIVALRGNRKCEVEAVLSLTLWHLLVSAQVRFGLHATHCSLNRAGPNAGCRHCRWRSGTATGSSSSCVIHIFDQIHSNFTWFDAPLSDAREKCTSASSLLTLFYISLFTLMRERSVEPNWKPCLRGFRPQFCFWFSGTFRSSLQEGSSHYAWERLLWSQSFVMRYISPMEMCLLAVVKLLPGNTFKGIV